MRLIKLYRQFIDKIKIICCFDPPTFAFGSSVVFVIIECFAALAAEKQADFMVVDPFREVVIVRIAKE